MTKQQAQAAWLAERLMGYRQVQREEDKGPWWEKPEGEPVAPVAHWDPDFPAWAPFEIIAQAKEVQAAMVKRKWTWAAKNLFYSQQIIFIFVHPDTGHAYRASADTEAAAICLAAGRALGWPFEEEE